MKKLLQKVFGTRNQRLLKIYRQTVTQINLLEPNLQQLSDSELKNKTSEFKQRVNHGEALNSILVEAFAVCREAAKRVLNMRHFDVQLIGGMVLHQGKIAEMRTGEGKTLMATLAAYLNALSGNGVHIVTVNDYLARRDAIEMGKLYQFLGLSVGINLPDMPAAEKIVAYNCDITYGTNNEYGFDYLRDNMVFSKAEKVQRKLNFAIVDEVDSILIDEARTPLIISGPSGGTDEMYIKLNQVPPLLKPQAEEDSKDGDYWVDEKNHNVVLSESGHERVEQILTEMGLLQADDSLYNAKNISLMHYLLSALRAHYAYFKDQHYVVQNHEIVIVDEFTGRLMAGRRWSEGLHQAVEAKEGVPIQRENQTMASITFQNYFRMYSKLSGMTGTADTEAYEFQQIYNLETVVIPTNKPMVRNDFNDKIYLNVKDKYSAIIKDIRDHHHKGQPVLVGTTSVENSEIISQLLTKSGLAHKVLNAKHHASEADVIVQAGAPKAITVATNMAGRGTDIILGGSPRPELAKIDHDEQLSAVEKKAHSQKILDDWQIKHDQVIATGGLAIIGTERHESRRIDNQLRGRAGRQGDPGASSFYLSLDDALLRIFGGDRIKGMMQKLGMKEGEAIEHKWLSRSIESAQRKVEGHNFDTRKQLLDYDNVYNDQRKVIYEQRDRILSGEDLNETAIVMIEGVINQIFDEYIPPKSMEEMWNIGGLEAKLSADFAINYPLQQKLKQHPDVSEVSLKDEIIDSAKKLYIDKVSKFKQVATQDFINYLDSILVGDDVSQWNIGSLDEFCMLHNKFTDKPFVDYVKITPNLNKEQFKQHVLTTIGDYGLLQVNMMERSIFLQHIDYYWREHLTQLDHLRQGIHLRGYAQKDPKQEFQTESFALFSSMLDNVKYDLVKALLNLQIRIIEQEEQQKMADASASTFGEIVSKASPGTKNVGVSINGKKPNPREQPKVSRNSLCLCGSGKKYKHCHGKLS